MEVAHAFFYAFWLASLREAFCSLYRQEFGDDCFEVLGVPLSKLGVGLLVSHSELLKILSSLSFFQTHLISPICLMSFSPGVVQWLASRLICALLQSAVLPIWWNGKWVDYIYWSSGQASLESLLVASPLIDKQSVQDLGKGLHGRHQDTSFVCHQLGISFGKLSYTISGDLVGRSLEVWIIDELAKPLCFDLRHSLNLILVDFDDNFLLMGDSDH